MNPHLSQPIAHRGCAPESARVAAILAHGRGRDTADILGIADRLDLADVAWLAPAAFENAWYPDRFMAPRENNQPRLDQALQRIHTLVADLSHRGFGPERVVLLGFSQGGCLISEYAARNARRYGAVIVLTGGLIGPPGTQWDADGDFGGTPVFLGTSDIDEWVPLARVEETARVLRRMGAEVQLSIYPGMEHIVNDDEIARARALILRAGTAAR